MTIVDVCNRALSRIGVARIVALVEGSVAARAMSACFPSVPDSMLASYVWSFAISRKVLDTAEPRTVANASSNWAYELPADCLAVAPERECGGLRGRIEGGLFLTQQGPPLDLRYVAQMTDASVWDPAFCEVLAWRLALEVQPELAPGFADARLQAGLARSLRNARRLGAIEASGTTLENSVWLVSRL
jgi:hypothetical protein